MHLGHDGKGHAVEEHPLLNLLIGRPLETAESGHQKVGKAIGLTLFASDALSSVGYATQEIILVLIAASMLAMRLSMPIAGAISLLLIILVLSYRQTIFAYPGGGGAYIVARDNFKSRKPARAAGAALILDYVLTVAVSISSGVEQITSAVPQLAPYAVGICLLVLFLMTVINLRGVKESGRVFAGPVYAFIVMTFATLGIGVYKSLTGTLAPVTGVEVVHVDTVSLSVFLILRAFSSGCTALTGVEAISNGITAFKGNTEREQSRNAATTMAWMAGILLLMFNGITYLALQVNAVPSESETVISQVARAVLGVGGFYYAQMALMTLILLMAANTSFNGEPRLCSLIADDKDLPRILGVQGTRLVFSWGIATLSIFAGLLIVIFNGKVSLLIPLYAIGVFLSFTVSQIGMCRRWLKIAKLRPGESIKNEHGPDLVFDRNWRVKLGINAFGAFLTALVTVVFAIAKFREGAWITVVVIPALMVFFWAVNRHYTLAAYALSLENVYDGRLAGQSMIGLVLVENANRLTLRAIRFAEMMGYKYYLVHISTDEKKTEKVKEKWEKYIKGRYGYERDFQVIQSPYRFVRAPIVALVDQIEAQHPDTNVNVIMGHIVTKSWWSQLLHFTAYTLAREVEQRPHMYVTYAPATVEDNKLVN